MTLMQSMYETGRMTPASLAFLFVLLPLSVFLYYVVPGRFRPLILLLVSLHFYAWAEPSRFWILAGSVALDCAAVRLMCGRFAESRRGRRACLAFVAAKNLGLLLVYGAYTQIAGTPQLLGLQIFTLSSIGAAADLYDGNVPGGHHPISYGLYCTFYPVLYAGPLSRYQDFLSGLAGARLNLRGVLAGLGRFAEGAFKAGLIGGSLYGLYSREIGRFAPGEVSALSSWCLVLFAALALYYMLSGFSDMACGIGAVYGFQLPQNFYYPYQSRSVEDFFDRFHITVVRFIRERACRVARGEKRQRSPYPDMLNTLLAGMLMGLWFGFRPGYLLWGAFLALFVLLERYLYPGLLERVPTLFRRVGTLCVVLAGFTIFLPDSLSGSLQMVRSLLDFTVVCNDRILYLLSSNWLLLLIACFFATNAASLLVTRLRRAAPAVSAVALGLVDIAVFIVYVALSLN